jgi:EAL domain-containing protein (putative c-di-GMP-specific phosphodiesterase class I)
MAVAPQSITAATSLGGILRDGLTRAHCQPIVDLDTGDVVAFEALARGPEGSTLERPDLDRRFEFVLTYERELVIDVASTLLARIAPA